MAQKKIKKPKNTGAKKSPAKTAKPVKAKGGAAPKKAQKPTPQKKAGAKEAKKKPALKIVPAKPAKKDLKAEKKAKAPAAKVEAKKLKGAGKPAKPEQSKQAAKESAPAQAGAAKGKKKGEVVLVVPAAKGVAILGRETKKKGKGSESASVSSKRRCREPGCDHEFLLSGYCRLHYIKNWRKIKRKEAILASGQLNNYVEELVSKYPDKYLDVIRQDLASEKDWSKVVIDLELESSDEEGAGDEDLEGVAEGVRRDRDFDDDSDSF